MTIEEAISSLESQAVENDILGFHDSALASRLGAEALRRVKADRSLPYPIVSDPLPGETLPPGP